MFSAADKMAGNAVVITDLPEAKYNQTAPRSQHPVGFSQGQAPVFYHVQHPGHEHKIKARACKSQLQGRHFLKVQIGHTIGAGVAGGKFDKFSVEVDTFH